jgi:hypothetical protein
LHIDGIPGEGGAATFGFLTNDDERESASRVVTGFLTAYLEDEGILGQDLDGGISRGGNKLIAELGAVRWGGCILHCNLIAVSLLGRYEDSISAARKACESCETRE